MPATTALLCVTLAGVAPCANASPPQPGSDLAVIRERVVASMLPPRAGASNMSARVCAASDRYVGEMSADGSWPDVNYTTPGSDDPERSWWNAAVHLQRSLIVGAASRSCPDAASRSRAARAAVRTAAFWIDNDFAQSNWWWNWIGTPRAVAKLLLLLPEDGAGVGALVTKARPIVLRANYSHPGNPNEATNLVWMSTARVMYGALTNDAAMVSEAAGKIASTVQVDVFGEGLQEDGSWHQHGPQLYSGWGYGAIWTTLMLSMGNALHNTSFALNGAVDGVERMILDGERWMTTGPNFDYTTCGRLMTYFTNETGPERLNFGHYHYFAAFTPFEVAFPDFPDGLTPLAVVFRGLLEGGWTETFPRAAEIRAFARQLDVGTSGPVPSSAVTIEGNRHFWNSDYMAHRRLAKGGRAEFVVSVRMFSNRTVNTECGNQEGKQNRHVADGVTNVYTTGREFENIYPVWDWHLVPGTVEFHSPPPAVPSCATGNVQDVPHNHFVGGVSDGDVGFVAMDYGATEDGGGTGSIRLHRSWFMLDSTIVVVANGTVSGSLQHRVTTALDQRLLGGSVTYSAGGRQGTVPTGEAVNLTGVDWVHHGTVAYGFPASAAGGEEAPRVSLSARSQTGSWYDITQGDSTPITRSVFAAFVDHGTRTGPLAHAYVILAGITAAASVPGELELATSSLSVTNGFEAQHACAPNLNGTDGATMMSTLWYEGAAASAAAEGCWNVTLIEGVLGQGTMVMLRRLPAPATPSLLVSASNPHAEPGRIVLYVSGRYQGESCSPFVNGTTAVTLTVPGESGRPSGQGVSGKTVTTRCILAT